MPGPPLGPTRAADAPTSTSPHNPAAGGRATPPPALLSRGSQRLSKVALHAATSWQAPCAAPLPRAAPTSSPAVRRPPFGSWAWCHGPSVTARATVHAGGYPHGSAAASGVWESHDRADGGAVGSDAGSGSDGDASDGGAASSGSRSGVVLTTADEDTIAAVVTGMAAGAVSIIRVSGSEALSIACRVFRPGGRYRLGWQPATHRVYYGTAVDGDERTLDEVLLLCMRSPRSYTGEDVVELHCHGGPVCCGRIVRALIEAGARPARAGEFTLRAFLNGRLDLAQAESVSELLSARTPAAADCALAGLGGGVGATVGRLRARCLDVMAELEARLDFDEDLPPIDVPALKRCIEEIQAGIELALRTARSGSLLRRGLQVAIVGRPNVGKSSLLNAWTNSERAIVTEVAGTTRDVLEASLSVGGVPVTLLDTAGIRDSADIVERIGVERSQAAASAADMVVMVVDGAAGWTEADGEIFTALWGDGPGTPRCRVKGPALLVANKDDLRPAAAATGREEGDNGSSSRSDDLLLPLVARETFAGVVRTSAAQRRGLQDLDEALLQLAGAPQLASGGVSWSVNERQAEALVRSHEALMRLSESMAAELPLDFWTIDLRAALLALGEISGDEVAEEVLDAVFSRFCIGK